MAVRDDPNVPSRAAIALGQGVRQLVAHRARLLDPAEDKTARALTEIRLLRELIYQAEYELVLRGQSAHGSGATWAQIAEASGHRTHSAARRYFIDEPVTRRHREQRDRAK